MATYEIVPATLEHAVELAATMRAEDRDELAAFGVAPYEALVQSMEVSRDAKTGLVDGRVLCMFGTGKTSILSDEGYPWALGSTEVPKHWRAFLRGSKQEFLRMRQENRRLCVLVPMKYTAAVRWLRWLGFEADNPIRGGATAFYPMTAGG